MRLVIALTILMGLMSVTACNDPAADQPRATTGAPTQASPQQNVAGAKYVIAPPSSKVEFIGSKVTGKSQWSLREVFRRDRLRGYAGEESRERHDRDRLPHDRRC